MVFKKVNEDVKVDKRILQYVGYIKQECLGCDSAFFSIADLVNKRLGSLGSTEHYVDDLLFQKIGYFLNHYANISKCIHPATNNKNDDLSNFAKKRGVRLHELFTAGNADNTVKECLDRLKNKDARNHLEHFASRIDQLYVESQMKCFVTQIFIANDSNVDLEALIPSADGSKYFLRVFYAQDFVVEFFQKKFNIKDRFSDIKMIHKKCQELEYRA